MTEIILNLESPEGRSLLLRLIEADRAEDEAFLADLSRADPNGRPKVIEAGDARAKYQLDPGRIPQNIIIEAFRNPEDSYQLRDPREIRQRLEALGQRRVEPSEYVELPQSVKNAMSEDKIEYAVLYFWGVFCPPCAAISPVLGVLNKKLKVKGKAAVYLIESKESSVQQMLRRQEGRRERWETVLAKKREQFGKDVRLFELDDKKMAAVNPESSLPYLIVVDKNGQVLHNPMGKAVHTVEDKLRSLGCL